MTRLDPQPDDASACGSSPLAAFDVAVWYWRTDWLDEGSVNALKGNLSIEERGHADRLVYARDRRDYVAAHALLRRTLSRYGPLAAPDWRFTANENGKPSLLASQHGFPPLAFNLSHTEGLVACAVVRGTRVGIDVERIKPWSDARAVAEQFFAMSEVRSLETVPPDQVQIRFTEIWTLKESYVKGTGAGLSVPLDSFAFTLDGTRSLRFKPPRDATRWRFVLAAPSTDTRLAVAVECGSTTRNWRISLHAAPQPIVHAEGARILASG